MNLIKKLVIGTFLCLFLVSCETYVTECATPSLSGKYVIGKVDIHSVKQDVSRDTILLSTDLCKTPLPYPFDSFYVDDLFIHLDNSSIRLNNLGVDGNGRDMWELGPSFYTIYNCTPFYVGDLQFKYEFVRDGQTFRPTLTFFVVDDGVETLVLKSKGVWPSKEMGEKVDVTLYLFRVGP